MNGFKEYVLNEEEDELSFKKRNSNKDQLNVRDPDEEVYNYFRDLLHKNPRYMRKDGGLEDTMAHWQSDEYGPRKKDDVKGVIERAWQDARDEYVKELGRSEEAPREPYAAPSWPAGQVQKKTKREKESDKRVLDYERMQQRDKWDKPYLGGEDDAIDKQLNRMDMTARQQYSRDMSWPTSYAVSQYQPKHGEFGYRTGKEPDFGDQLDARRRRKGFEITPEQIERIRQLSQSGWKEKAIAVELDIPVSVVKQHMTEEIPLATRAEPPPQSPGMLSRFKNWLLRRT